MLSACSLFRIKNVLVRREDGKNAINRMEVIGRGSLDPQVQWICKALHDGIYVFWNFPLKSDTCRIWLIPN